MCLRKQHEKAPGLRLKTRFSEGRFRTLSSDSAGWAGSAVLLTLLLKSVFLPSAFYPPQHLQQVRETGRGTSQSAAPNGMGEANACHFFNSTMHISPTHGHPPPVFTSLH